jgi:hypothetical protein
MGEIIVLPMSRIGVAVKAGVSVITGVGLFVFIGM